MKQLFIKLLYKFRRLFHGGKIPYFNCNEEHKNGKRKKYQTFVKSAQFVCEKTENLIRAIEWKFIPKTQ